MKLSYNLDGSLSSRTDPRTTVVQYTYTDDRRLELQRATTLGGSTDDHVKSIKFAYDDIGRMETITSYANNDGTGTVRNQIVLEYADYGPVTKNWQSHEGAKDGGTPNVQYAFDPDRDRKTGQ